MKFATVFLSVLGALLPFIGEVASAQAIQPFYAPAQLSGSMEVRLHPMENVIPGTAQLVTFGVPFTRGSVSLPGLSAVRVLRGGVEVPAHVESQTPWRHLTSAAVDGQSVRVALVQIQHTFAVAYPGFESVTVEWGGLARTQDRPALVDPLTGWHPVTSGTFVAEDGISEPNVYALLPKAVLAQGVLTLRRAEPFANSIAETRDDPAAMDAVQHWPGYEEADRAFKNNFFTSINEDDPLLTEYGNGRLSPYRLDDATDGFQDEHEPWLYDRSSTFFHLYLKTGFLRPLREAVRSTQYYRTRLHGASASPSSSAGIFRLKQRNASGVTGGNDAMYSYAECFAYDYWLTGDPQAIMPVRWVVTAHNTHTEPSRWGPGLGVWTERHTAFALLANVVAFELTGETAFRQAVLSQTADFIWHQNGAGGQLPVNRLDGGLYHYGAQHGDGDFTALVASPWMTSLTIDAMTRAYGVSEEEGIANFVVRAARFQAAATHFDEDHDYDTAGAALRYPHYLTRFDGAPDAIDGYDSTAINHALEVSATVAWGAYFQHLLNGLPDPTIEAAARDLYAAFDEGVNYWIRPAAPPLGLAAFRVNPWRKFGWEFRPASGLSWVMNQIDAISPPPTVAITAPTNGATFTAPANFTIQATATSPNATITKVEFFAGSTLLGEDTTAPYSFQWNGVIQNLTGYTLSAKATTSLGVVGYSPGVTLEVRSPTTPTLVITNPANGANFTAPANLTITASATPQASSSIARVEFLRGGIEQFSDTIPPFAHVLSGVLAGSYQYEVRAFDSNGGYTIQFVNFTVTSPTPPNVTLTAPAAGTQTTGGAVLHMAATASAAGSNITRVEFIVDGEGQFEDTTAPYEFNWSVPANWPAGAHTISARAVETNGGSAVSSATVQAVTLPPLTVAFDFPAAGTEFQIPVTIATQVTANAPGSSVARVEFFANNIPIGTDTTAPYTASFEPDARQWTLVARAFDILGRSAQASRTVFVSGVAIPVVTLTSPVDGAVLVAPATVTLQATASVAGGNIARVQFYDGGTLLGEDTTAPFSFTTSTLSLGGHTFTATAIAAGTGQDGDSAPVTIIVGEANAPVVAISQHPGTVAGIFTEVVFGANAGHTAGGAITRVEFFLDNALIGTDTTAPYAVTWAVAGNYGYHQIRARAFDTAGAQANSATVGFELILPPIVAIAAPLPPALVRPGLAREISAAVTPGNHSITEVRFFVNGALLAIDTTAPYSTPWTPAAPGSYQIMAEVSDSRGLDRSSAPVTVVSGFTAQEQWRFTHFATYDGIGSAADTADPDFDGLPNLVEFGTGQNPRAASLPPQPGSSGGYLTLTFTRALAASGVTLVVEANGELAHAWTPGSTYSRALGDTPGTLATSEIARAANGPVETITVRDNTPISAAPGRFLRLRASQE